jgi:transaldolase
MRPEKLRTRIFLDGGDPEETRHIIALLGFLDGQTTNPTLISRNPEAKKRLKKGGKFREEELLEFYQNVVVEISSLIPEGSVSVEVYADLDTTSSSMLMQGREMFSWVSNAHIKFPTNAEGLQALSEAIASGLRANMTLCFKQDQAAAVYAASRGAHNGDVFVSPFVGRLDDRGQNGMSLIANILRMYRVGDGRVQVLTASVRGYEHLQAAIAMGSDIVTAPFEVLKEWGMKGLQLPGKDYLYRSHDLEDIPYIDLDLDQEWEDYDIFHELTNKGIQRFAEDWSSLLV